MTDKEQSQKAKEFVEFWKDRGYEKGQSQTFWLQLLSQVFGIEHPEEFIEFEDQVHIDKSTGFIDGYIPSTKILIEQKSIEKDLRKGIRQSDGTYLNPFQQAKKYIAELPLSKHPKYVITCNFRSFLVYNMDNPNGEPEEILLEDLEKDYYRLQFIVNSEDKVLKREMDISFKAGELVGKIYDEILPLYKNPESEESLRSLNALCVRLVFCLYAEDSGIFGKRMMFHNYLSRFDSKDLRKELIELFKVLDTKEEDRDPYLLDELAEFPYVNGGLFADENIEIPNLNDNVKEILLSKASEDFDWSDISPTIFGAIFESTLNQETRRKGGMHYTSIENIHKVIDPLFLNELKEELQEIKQISVIKTKRKKLEEFQNKLASLKFLDPACGSGNFLTETYLSLRKLENEAIIELTGGQIAFGDETLSPIKVSIGQFYGIEINDFAVTVAKTALWIAESQMMKKTEDILHINLDFLPLKSYTNIIEANALRIDWNDVVPKEELNYIMGNPPFVGARLMDKEQKKDVEDIFKETKNAGNLDYVSCWYKKSANYIKGTEIEVALVSTNSICQGEQPAILWKCLFEAGIYINFAHKTFRWDSEAKEKAKVFCIIVSFSYKNRIEKYLYENNNERKVQNINAYLIDAPKIFIESRNNPICNSPKMGIGNKPIDGGFYLFTKEEKESFIKKEPNSERWFKKWYGSQEFIDNNPRYCLWLKNCPPNELKKMPECIKRIEAVRKYRLNSKSEGTRKIAETPLKFHVENFPKGTYIVIPEVSTDKRRYIPIGFMDSNVLCSNLVKITETASLYHFGILTSNVHMAWVRFTCGRLGNGYRYSVNVVYNNFPWPNPTEKKKAKIEQTAQAILGCKNTISK